MQGLASIRLEWRGLWIGGSSNDPGRAPRGLGYASVLTLTAQESSLENTKQRVHLNDQKQFSKSEVSLISAIAFLCKGNRKNT
eukprot:254419-Pelagomonas_calceolata.AAC.2